jgi:2-methylisocitrate lyase-like PEP mutase family enzyme
MNVTQSEKAARFRALHDGSGAFVIPNPWDVGSARILAGLGFQALATSSAASAAAIGRRDGGLTRDEALAHPRLIVDAKSPRIWNKGLAMRRKSWRRRSDLLPAWDSWDAPLRIPLAMKTNLSMTFTWLSNGLLQPRRPRALKFPFILAARAHNLLYANSSLDDTISRLQAFEKAGADVLFAPGLSDLAAVRAVCTAVSKPVNFMVGIKGKSFSVAELAAAGVRRISLATSLYRAAMTGFLEAIREVKDTGQFDFLDRCVATPELIKLMRI